MAEPQDDGKYHPEIYGVNGKYRHTNEGRYTYKYSDYGKPYNHYKDKYFSKNYNDNPYYNAYRPLAYQTPANVYPGAYPAEYPGAYRGAYPGAYPEVYPGAYVGPYTGAYQPQYYNYVAAGNLNR